jgi:signal transduction histidine kinase
MIAISYSFVYDGRASMLRKERARCWPAISTACPIGTQMILEMIAFAKGGATFAYRWRRPLANEIVEKSKLASP